MAYISGTKIVPNMGFVQKHSKLYKFSLQKKIIKSYRQNFSINSKNPVFGPFLVHFPNFGAKDFILGNPALLRTTSYGFLTQCKNF